MITIAKREKPGRAIVEQSAVAFLMSERRSAMPYKPKRPCSFPGCPNLTEGRFCPEHEKQENRRYEKYDRDPAVKRRYGRAWKRIRDKYVQQHPVCELCYKKGLLVETEQVHHKRPLSEGGDHSKENLIALCSSCHARIHAERGDRWHTKQGLPKSRMTFWEEDEQRSE
jgi:5-methylcytosine-specific restriction protein A